MRSRDEKYKLTGVIEIDDAFFGGTREGGDKRGRGSSKTPVIVETSTGKGGVGYARMKVVGRIDGDTIKEVVKADVKHVLSLSKEKAKRLSRMVLRATMP